MNTLNEPVSTVRVCVCAYVKERTRIYLRQRGFRIVALFD